MMIPSVAIVLCICAAIVQASPAVTSTCSSAPVPSAPPVGSYVYNGCWNEAVNTRTLNLDFLMDAEAMTVQECETFCANGGFPVFGVEFGTQCFCGTYMTHNVTMTSQLSCLVPCVGNAAESCGGADLLDVYILNNYTQPSIPPTVGAYTYQGCFTEAPSPNRALSGAHLIDPTMTVEMCESFCSAGGFSIFGTEFADECYCGDSLGFGSSIAPGGNSECTMTCVGNYTELACGDANRLSVYELTG